MLIQVPNYLLQLFQEETEVFAGYVRTVSSPVPPGSASGLPPSWKCLKHLLGEVSRGHHDQMSEPHQLALLDVEEQRPAETAHSLGV